MQAYVGPRHQLTHSSGDIGCRVRHQARGRHACVDQEWRHAGQHRACNHQHMIWHDDVIKWTHFPGYSQFVRGNSPVPGEFPAQRPVMQSFGVFFYLRPNKRLSKHSWGWWFEKASCSLWRHCNGFGPADVSKTANKLLIQLISPWTKWLRFRKRYFQLHFREWKVLYFD